MALIRGKDILTVAIAQGGAGTTDLVAAPNAATRIYVVHLAISISAGGTIKFQSGTGPTDITGAFALTTTGPLVMCGDADGSPLFASGKGEKLTLVSVTGAATGFLTYFTAPHGGI